MNKTKDETSELTPDDLIIQKHIATRRRRGNWKKKIIVCEFCGNVSINNTHRCFSKWNRFLLDKNS